VGIKQFKPNRLYDPEILELTDKVKIEVDHGIEKLYPKVRGAEVQITLKNGRTLKKRVNLPKGEVETPLSQEEMEAKFKYCTEDLFDGVRQDEVMQTVRKLDRIENVRELMQLLA
jgi:2-methylcitrate dehydratase PrpD